MFGKRILSGAAIAAAVALPLSLVATAPASAAPKKPKLATVSVLHGIPAAVAGPAVDVYVNGNLTIDDFTPGSLKTLKVPAGTYDLAVYANDVTPATGAPIPGLSGSATVKAGKNYTVTANLKLTGGTPAVAPALNVFQNNLSATGTGKGRITVRHVAAAPAVDVFVNGQVAFSNLTNPNQASAVLPKGTYQAAAGLAGAGLAGIAVGPIPVEVKEGYNLIVYAWGIPQTVGGEGVQVAAQYVKTVKNKK